MAAIIGAGLGPALFLLDAGAVSVTHASRPAAGLPE